MCRKSAILAAFLCVFFENFQNAASFNFEERNPAVRNGKVDSYFGYSVAQHKTDDGRSWMLVGAPLGHNLQPNTSHSGALFKCLFDLQQNFGCLQVETDGRRLAGGEYLSNNFDYDEAPTLREPVQLLPPGSDEIKEGQWLGVNVRSQGPGGKVIVCAHRYITSPKLSLHHFGLGLCYSLKNNLEYDDKWEPCKGRPMNLMHQQFGYCQVGTSLALLSDGTALIGSPGPYTWRGTMFVVNIVGDFLTRDKNIYLGPLNDKPEPIEKYSYLGMSVAAGKFFDKTKTTYASGAPRSHLHGQVYFFNKIQNEPEMEIPLVINGEQFGSSFGYEILSVDLNRDGYDDLLVGAPFYFNNTVGGVVYVYYDLKGCLHDKKDCKSDLVLKGPLESRFGFSMTSLGDINRDNYNDVAIGAPYEGGGAIYIYLSSKDGLNPEYSQKIHPEVDGLRTFGYSLSGGLDMDDNGYPDLLTGAYESDKVILYRTRPIIDIKVAVTGRELENINVTKRGCNRDRFSNSTCFSFKTCFVISPVEQKTSLKDVKVRYIIKELNDKLKFSRIWIHDPDNVDMRKSKRERIFHNVEKNVSYCEQELVYIKENIRDILSPITFLVNYTLYDFAEYSPILNKKRSTEKFEATFQKNCGDDDICQSNLVLTAEMVEQASKAQKFKLYINENNELHIDANVTNYGESAYEAKLFVVHPLSLSYIALHEKSSDILCAYENDTLVICNLGNPFEDNKSVSLRLRFEVKQKTKENELKVKVFVNSTSVEQSKETSKTLVAVIRKRAELRITGAATSHVFYKGEVKGESAMQHFEDIGRRIWHKYQVENHGPWHAEEVEVVIMWPLQVTNNGKHQGKWLLYLEETPKIEGSLTDYCYVDPPDAVNPLKLNSTDVSTELDAPPENLMAHNFTQDPYGRRRKRDVEYVVKAEPRKGADGKERLIVTMDCLQGTALCVNITCRIAKLQKSSEATIHIKSRIWNSTLVEDYSKVDWVRILSRAFINVGDASIVQEDYTDDAFFVETLAYPEISQADGGVNIWIIIGAILIGLIVLTILIILLWKLGFFKRNRIDPTLKGNIKKQDEAVNLLNK